MKNITLYYAPDNASLIVRIVLEELGYQYQSVLVDRSIHAHQNERYLKINPTGLIPTCVIDGVVMTETAAISLSLIESAESTLAPGLASAHRPDFLRWLFFLSLSLIHI